MRAHSMEIRSSIFRAVQEGKLTQEEIAALFGVSSRFVRRLSERWRETGSLEPMPHGGGPALKMTLEIDRKLTDFLQQHSDATLKEIRVGCGLNVSLPAICNALKRLGLSRKKKVPVAAERQRPDVQAKRLDWEIKTSQIDSKHMIFIDQTAVSTKMQRDYGRAPLGQRVYGVVPQKHYHTSTLMGALGLDGRLETLVYDGGTDVAMMLTFVDNVLAPVLKPGDIVIWDNLKPHHSPSVIEAVERTGATVWALPPYSPDLNPIENLWSKIKTLLRGIAARTTDALLGGLARVMEAITVTDIQGWFANSGYRTIHT